MLHELTNDDNSHHSIQERMNTTMQSAPVVEGQFASHFLRTSASSAHEGHVGHGRSVPARTRQRE
eukprot:6582437-Pyramimonas_sp.AAC.1